MKREACRNGLVATALAWIAAVSDMGCLTTGFGMEVEHFWGLALVCAVCGAWGTVVLRRRWGDVATACVIALTAGYFWHADVFWEHLGALLRCVTWRYDSAYGWGTVSLNGYSNSGPVDVILGLIGCLSALSVSWVVVRRRSVLYALPAVILPLAACLVVTDTVPAAVWLYLLILAVALLLLTDYTRRSDGGGELLTVYLAVPVAVALGALFLLCPKEKYVNNAARYEEKLVAWYRGSGEDTRDAPASATAQEKVDLTQIGPRARWNYTVMEVTSSRGGALYLRGQDYDVYTGRGWSSTEERGELFGGGTVTGTVTVKPRTPEKLRYLPYYPAEAVSLSGGELVGEYARQYSFSVTDTAVSSLPGDCLTLPDQTEHWARKLVAHILSERSADQTLIAAIADHIRSGATYDLNTPQMPDGQQDFARWFLESSDTGYCVHFATSAVVLLRAAGIPARYVTGYLVNVEADQTVEVPEWAAHAWAEYYDRTKQAWMVLEVTPPEGTDYRGTQTTDPVQSQTVTASETDGQAPSTVAPTVEPTQVPDEPTPVTSAKEAPGWLFGVLWTAVAVLVLIAQSGLRRRLARRRRSYGSTNEQALERWHQACRLAGVLKLRVPGELDELAQKARFSQHALTAEELERFDVWQDRARARLRKMPLLRRLYAGLVLALW